MSFKIYTKTGDAGETGLYGGKRVSKDHLRIEAYGTVDELNAQLGLLGSFMESSDRASLAGATILRIQSELFTLGAQLANPDGGSSSREVPIQEGHVKQLESEIDALDADLPPLRNFILPAGSAAVTQAHVCRTVARRAERKVVSLQHAEAVDAVLIRYLNRLSDYLFTLARALSHAGGEEERPWIAGKR